MKNERLFQRVALVLVILIYIAARFWDLTTSCLWFDEIFSVHAAEHPWNSILAFIAQDLIHPPLFYVLLKLWISIGGDGVLWLRLFPFAWSLLAIFPFIGLCRELKLGKWTQVLALLLFAVNGALIKYAQEVRMYAPLLCLSLFSMWLFARYFIKGKSFLPLVIVNVLMVYTHYFGWFVVFSEVILILWFQRIKWRRIAVMLGIVSLAFLPWLITVVAASKSGFGLSQNIGWMSRPGPTEIIGFVLDIVEPFYYQASSAEPSSYFLISVPVLILIGLAKLGYLSSMTAEADRRTFYFLGVFIGVAISIALIASWIGTYSIWGTRHLIIVFPPMLVLSAVFVAGIRYKVVRGLAVAGILVLIACAFAVRATRTTTEYSWCGWEALTQEWLLFPHYSGEKKQVFATEELIGYHIWFAARQFPDSKVSVVKGLAGTNEDPAYFLPRGFDEVTVVNAGTAFSEDEFWIAFRDPDWDHDVPGIAMFRHQPQVLLELSQLGFSAEQVLKRRAGGESMFFARMVRRPEQH